ncbi:hypothetical protein [Oceanobacter kriegii]|uniref:hypothetical protein n=1 Tax=Oceanobacter kriegii TaxID=64972 RepID=UPI0003F592BF|nr:hypothetical protein [Oceanobacter kriegii]
MTTHKTLWTAVAAASLIASAHHSLAATNIASTAPTDTASAHSVPAVGSFAADISDNTFAYIPPQCFTDPVDTDGSVKNPCYACHTMSKTPNFFNDIDVQLAYAFPENATTNRWLNMFADRSEFIEKTSDASMLNYVREDNYFDEKGRIQLAETLAKPPQQWDRNSNGQWDGYTPDVWFNFDSEGFDRTPAGDYSGWRVFAYYPFEGTFFPTNGSTDDVMIRLAPAFQQTEEGKFDLTTYKVNLAIVEAMVKAESIAISAVDENRFGVDLDKDGKLGEARQVTYDWAPLEKRFMSYVGLARQQLQQGDVHLAKGLYPEGTEFVHSVRYLDVQDGQVTMAKRMKELRYSQKQSWRNYYKLRQIVNKEIKERHDFPDRQKTVFGNMEEGMVAQYGWRYQGFIEDAEGALRPQNYEETLFCMGCHGNIGAQTDTTLSFARKFGADSHKQGWYHWMEKSLQGVADPKREDGTGQYAYYLQNNPTGNEYRTNMEVYNKFFNQDGSPKEAAFAKLENDISYLLMPSPQRAMQLNKAYKAVVEEQSFKLGRDAILDPHNNVHDAVEMDQETGIQQDLTRY